LAKFHNFARTLDAAVGAGAFFSTREGLSNKPLIIKNGPGLAEIVIQRVKRGRWGEGASSHASVTLAKHSLTNLRTPSLRCSQFPCVTHLRSPTPFTLPYGVARPLHGATGSPAALRRGTLPMA